MANLLSSDAILQLAAILSTALDSPAPGESGEVAASETRLTLAKHLFAHAASILQELHRLIEEERWQEVDELARTRWEVLRDASLRPFLARLDEPLEWFALMEQVDERILSWLTDAKHRQHVREALTAVEGRLDRLVHQGVDLLLDMPHASSRYTPLLARLARHEATIQRWLTFLLFEIFPVNAHGETP